MKLLKTITILSLISTLFISTGCKNMSRTQKGAVLGTGGGAVLGTIIGRASGNTSLGALIGATVGGATGAVIGRQMDKQAEDIRNSVPGAQVYRVGEGIIVEFSDKILFGFDQSELNPTSTSNLNKLKVVLNKYPDTNIEIQGHTDNTGADNYNMSLSKRRASSVSRYMVNSGISSRRISTKGYGESAPKYSNDNEEGRAQNRRVEFLISANQKMQNEAKTGSN
ncbi:MAG: OmpA family protein [bacterium]|nr:OmpA family protein [bacterium]